MFSISYYTMTALDLVSDGRNDVGNRPPRSIGSSASRLMQLIDGSHYDVKVSPAKFKLRPGESATYTVTITNDGTGAGIAYTVTVNTGSGDGTTAPQRRYSTARSGSASARTCRSRRR